jgi:uncharacterized protein YlxP (DUF503 family)
MFVAVALFEIHIEFAESLKDKRMVVKSLRDKLRSRFEMSVAEVALHDVHQRARLALSFIAIERPVAQAQFERIQTFIESNTDAVLAFWTSELLDFDEDAGL